MKLLILKCAQFNSINFSKLNKMITRSKLRTFTWNKKYSSSNKTRPSLTSILDEISKVWKSKWSLPTFKNSHTLISSTNLRKKTSNFKKKSLKRTIKYFRSMNKSKTNTVRPLKCPGPFWKNKFNVWSSRKNVSRKITHLWNKWRYWKRKLLMQTKNTMSFLKYVWKKTNR